MKALAIGEPRGRIELRLRLPLVWLALLLAVAAILPDRIWNTLLVGLGGLFIVAYIWARQLAGGLSAQRKLRHGWVSVGDRLQEDFILQNRSWLPALWVEVLDQSTVPGYQPAVVRSVGPLAVERWRQSAICLRRGQFQLGPWSIRSSDPFGVFRVSHHYSLAEEVIIHPPIHRQLAVTLPAGQSSGRARARQQAWQATLNAASVRGYQPEDPFRWIHWPTTARKDALHVRQFDLDTAGDLWLLLDMQAAVQLGQEANGTEEHAVLLAASLAAQALQKNRAVGLATYGRQPQLLPPGHGKGHLWKLLRALALARADGATPLDTALRDLNRVIQRGASAIVITPSSERDWLPGLLPLAQRGIQSSVVLLDRLSFGGGGNSEALGSAIRALLPSRPGSEAFIIKQGDMGQAVEAQARRGHWEFRVLATGKVVTLRSPEG